MRGPWLGCTYLTPPTRVAAPVASEPVAAPAGVRHVSPVACARVGARFVR